MSEQISQNQIKELRKKFSNDNHIKVVRNAMIKTNSNELSMDWEKYRKIDHSFSHVISGEMPATNQKSSGRCWGFAGLNLFRIYLGRKYSIKDFQFSQSYFMFWDKLEKSNYFLESIIKTAKEDWNSRMERKRREEGSDSTLNMAVLEFLVADGRKDAAIAFREEAGLKDCVLDLGSIERRSKGLESIRRGEIPEVLEMLKLRVCSRMVARAVSSRIQLGLQAGHLLKGITQAEIHILCFRRQLGGMLKFIHWIGMGI